MIDQIKKFLEPLAQARLTDDEKEELRQTLFRRLNLNGAPAPSLTPSPYGFGFGRFFSALAQGRPAFLTAAVLVVGIFLGGGLSLAAEGSLPGGLLYPLKTKINEPLIGLLSPNPTAKIWWQTEVVNRRLVESEQLIAEVKTEPAAIQNLNRELNKQIAKIQNDLANLKTESGAAEGTTVSRNVSRSVNAKLETDLRHHKKSLADKPAANVKIIPQVEQLTRSVGEQADAVAKFGQPDAAATSSLENSMMMTPPPETITKPELAPAKR